MRLFKRVVDLLVKMMVPFVILTLMVGMAKIILDLKTVYQSATIAAGFGLLITNTLSMFIVIEMLRTILEYFEIHRLKITFIIDGALVFIIREIMIGVYEHKMGAVDLLSLSALLLVLGSLRTFAIIYSPNHQKED